MPKHPLSVRIGMLRLKITRIIAGLENFETHNKHINETQIYSLCSLSQETELFYETTQYSETVAREKNYTFTYYRLVIKNTYIALKRLL